MEDTMNLIERSHHGDKEAREQLVEENMGLVWSVVRRFAGRGTDMEDLFQIGAMGLIKAIDKFDLSFEVKFSTYAVPMIAGEIKRFLRDDGMVKVSRTLKENYWKIRRETEKFSQRQGRDPTLAELETLTELTKEEIVQSLESSAEVESIYKPMTQNDGSEIYLVDRLESRERGMHQLLDHVVLQQLLTELPGKERELIMMRYLQEKTQTEVAKVMGISQVQVSRMEKRVLRQLREKLIS